MDPIEEIKNKIDIVELIGEYVKLQKVGANWRGLCPFHHEKNPSFYVNPERQIWHCFGCSRGGSIFNFIMEIEGVDFGTALRMLAQRAGVQLRPVDKKLQSQKEILFKINQAAASFFERNLWQKKEVLEYLKERGLSKKTIKEFHLGFALDSFDSLNNYLKAIGYKKKDILLSGLAVEKTKNSQKFFYDRFRSRIIFPFFDLSGRIIGFSGRIFGQEIEGTGKYINTPQTLIFDKSRAVYGFHQTKKEIKEKDRILIVEGQMDLLSAWEKGMKFAVAVSGTALTLEQLRILSRFSKNLFLSLDMDEAGQLASERIIPLALSLGFKVYLLKLPFGKDLSEFLNKAEEKEINNLFSQPIAVMDFYFQRALSLADKETLEGKKIIVDFFLPKLKPLSPLERGFWLEKLSKELKIKEEYLAEQLVRAKKEELPIKIKEEEEESAPELSKTRREILGERILKILLKEKKTSLIEKVLAQKKFLPLEIEKSLFFLLGKKKFSREEEERINNFLGYLQISNEKELEKDLNLKEELSYLLKEIEKEFYLEELNQLNFKIKELEEKKEKKEKIIELLKKFKRYSEKLKELN